MRDAPFGADGIFRAPVDSFLFPGVFGGSTSVAVGAPQLSVVLDEEATLAAMLDDAVLGLELIFCPSIDFILIVSWKARSQ